MPRSSILHTSFADAFLASMRSCVARAYLKGGGVLIPTRNSPLARLKRLIGCVDRIRIYWMTRLYRSIWMTGFVKTLVVVLLGNAPLVAADSAVVKSAYANEDVALQLDPGGAFWRASPAGHMEKDRFGKVVPHYRTEIRTRWTKENLYFLFICPYEELHLKPTPNTTQETNQLWNWDVAEVF